nr:MAG: major capsid protein [Microvirus Sku120]
MIMSQFKDINETLRHENNALVNQNQRADTIMRDTGGYSTFPKSFTQATTFDSGKAVPILLQECYPGDYYKINVLSILRLSAMTSTPYMNINIDINFFFVPFDQLDKEFKNLMGENNEYGFSDTQIEFPKLTFDVKMDYTENDLAGYLNLPINTDMTGDEISNIYPFIAYGKIINEWYRDQNLQDNIDITTCFNESREIKTSTYNSDMSYLESILYGKGLAPTSKLPSYYTTNLPYQQKGQAISIGGFDLKDLVIGNTSHPNTLNLFSPQWYLNNGSQFSEPRPILANKTLTGYNDKEPTPSAGNAYMSLEIKAKDGVQPFNINDLRYSIVSQHLLENFALCGSRYVEQLKSIWGIEIDPKSINRTELIGGTNQDLVFNNVLQTSQSTADSLLGKIGTNLYNQIGAPTIEYAASQHGYIIGIATARTPINNGGQGFPKLFRQKNMYDLWNPMFNGIGEQPTRNDELYYNATDKSKNAKTFGWNEPFLSTKYNIDNASGFMSLKSKTSLFPMFLFGEKYTDTPILNAEWMNYNPNIIGNTLFNTTDQTKEFYHQFAGIFMFDIEYTTKQPLFNSPRVDYV